MNVTDQFVFRIELGDRGLEAVEIRLIKSWKILDYPELNLIPH